MDVKIKELVDAVVALQNGAVADDVAKHLDEVFNTCEVKVWREDTNIPLPVYGKDGDACCDVYAKSIEYDKDKDRYVVHTGLHFALPKNYEMELRPRSSNTKTEFYIPNSPGTLDSGYRGELMIIFKSRTNKYLLNCIDKIGSVVSANIPNNDDRYNVMVNAREDYESVRLNNIFPYKKGDRICQLLIRKREVIKWLEVESQDELGNSERGDGGFGSTGK